MSRLLSLFALLVLAAGLLAGGSVPVRAAVGHHHHATHTQAPEPCDTAAADTAAPCETHHQSDQDDGPTKRHTHGTAGCLCLTGACDLTALPIRHGEPLAHRLPTVLPSGEEQPAAIVHAPPLPPPRA